MYYYLKFRKKGTLDWKALRENGRILVFNRYESVKKYAENIQNFILKIVDFSCHPSDKKSPIYGKKYIKINW